METIDKKQYLQKRIGLPSWMFLGYIQITIGKFVFYKKGYKFTDYNILHEEIHVRQYLELGFFKFLFLYIYYYFKNVIVFLKSHYLREWLKDYPFFRAVSKLHNYSYVKIPFEREAYFYMYSLTYLSNRKKFAWRDFMNPIKESPHT